MNCRQQRSQGARKLFDRGVPDAVPTCFAQAQTNRESPIEFRILGPLDVRAGGDPVALGGAKQRAVLAALLLRVSQVVPIGTMIDDVWGERPPASAKHSLEVYISRLRRLFRNEGPSLARRGAGYCLELGDAFLDAEAFSKLADDVSRAVTEGDHQRVSDIAASALALWQGRALDDVALASAGRTEVDQLEELRLRLLEQRFDADLALGRHEAIVGELRMHVRQNQYRERFVAQLMLALYRSGRHVEALEAYEKMRTALAEDLGLQPSAELQQLSGQIVRQERELNTSTPLIEAATSRRTMLTKAREMSAPILAGALAAAALAVTASSAAPSAAGRNPRPAASKSTAPRAALVLPRVNPDPLLNNLMSRYFRSSASSWELESEIIAADEADLDERADERLRRRIEDGGFGLVMVSGDTPAARVISALVRQMPETRFVFIDASLADLSLDGVPNASAVRFADEQTSHLAGYLSALVPPRGGAPTDRVDTISVVAGERSAHTMRVIKGFSRGVQRGRRGVAVRVDYADDVLDRSACERIANDQIDAGSDVVFVEAGSCGLGALAVARVRGVWGIGGYDDGVRPGSHVLAITYKDWERAVLNVFNDVGLGTFRSGKDDVLGLNDDYAVGIDRSAVSSVVSESLWSRVVVRCTELRRNAEESVS